MTSIRIAAAILGCLPAAAPDRGTAAEDMAALTDGVRTIAAPGVPGPLCVFGDRAFVVLAADHAGHPAAVVAATRTGKGRAVAFGHDGYVTAGGLEVGQTARMIANAARWAGGADGPRRTRFRAAVGRDAALADALAGQGLHVVRFPRGGLADALDAADVLCIPIARITRDEDQRAVRRFLEGGGGLVAFGLGWGWKQLNPGRDLPTEHPGNRVLAEGGIVWADGTLRRTCDEGFAVAPPDPLAHAGRALDTVSSADERPGDEGAAAATLALALRAVPPADTLLLPRVRALARRVGREPIPTPKTPIRADDPIARVLLTWRDVQSRQAAPEAVLAHPAAATFPGAVRPDAPRVARAVAVDAARPGWHSTGLYAAPGEVVTAAIPGDRADGRLGLRIGAHADRLWHKKAWRRCPDICRQVRLTEPTTRLASPFGGLIYVTVDHRAKPGRVEVRLAGGAEAPLFRLGRTTGEQWWSIRGRPAPWAELAGRNVILTVPSRHVRALDDPAALMTFWDRVVDACADLAARPRGRERPERIVADEQIAAGYMHSGYPVMAHLDAAERMVDLDRLRTRGDWGLFHELGHNHQSADWTFAGTIEVTVNLFTVYVLETVCEPGAPLHGALRGDRPAKALAKYTAGGRRFADWKARPFLALRMYLQLKDAFGWETFRKVFAEYRDLPRDQRPGTDAAKRDQWLIRFSRAAGRDLGPFFAAWGVPVSDAARDAVADLPGWMPEGFGPPDAGQ